MSEKSLIFDIQDNIATIKENSLGFIDECY